MSDHRNPARRRFLAFLGNGVTPSHHIVETVKMVALGSDASRQVKDYYLSRAACYLAAMNGDPAKPAIAAAQAGKVTTVEERPA